MIGNIIGMLLVNIGAILLLDFLVVGVGFCIDLFQKDKEPAFVFFGVGVAIVASIFFGILSLILWGFWLLT